MKKTALTTALAIAMALPVAGVASANAIRYIVARDNVPVTFWDSEYNVTTECTLNSGTEIKVTYWAGTVRRIEVTEGPNKGCSGIVQTADIIQAPAELPDGFHN